MAKRLNYQTTNNDLLIRAKTILAEQGIDINIITQLLLAKNINDSTPKSSSQADYDRKKLRATLWGKYEGKILMSDDFDAPLPEMEDYVLTDDELKKTPSRRSIDLKK